MTIKYVNHRWNYIGDQSLEYGGFFYKEDGQEDYVLCVRITPCSDAGGPDNLFHIEVGSIYIKVDDLNHINRALDCCGAKLLGKSLKTISDNGNIVKGKAARATLIYACLAYQGVERDSETVVRIGPVDTFWAAIDGWNPKPDKILRANADLRNYVRREFLRS